MIKKAVFNTLCNTLTGSLISTIFGAKVPDLRWKGFRFYVDTSFVKKRQIASLFWGFYESSEIRFIEGHLDASRDVVELGASIGVVSSHIVRKLSSGRKLVSVEANPNLTRSILENIKRHNKSGVNFSLENLAINYSGQDVALRITGNNTETRIVADSENNADRTVVVKSIRLSELVAKHELDQFTLVCDIEGAEAQVLINDVEALAKCKSLFIELHDTTFGNQQYSVSDLVNVIVQKHHFKVVHSHSPVFHFEKADA